MKQKKPDLVLTILMLLMLFILIMMTFSCKPSPEADRELSWLFPPVVESVDAVAPIEAPPNQQPAPGLPPVRKPKPKPPICYPLNVRFDNAQWTALIQNFQWNEHYPVGVINTSATCSFTATLTWSVFFEGTLQQSGSCCLFTMAPNETKTLDFMLRPASAIPLPVDTCVLGIKAHN